MNSYTGLIIGVTLSLAYVPTRGTQRTSPSAPDNLSARAPGKAPTDVSCPPKEVRGRVCPEGQPRVSRGRGCTPLMRGAEGGNIGKVRALLKAGADVNAALPHWGHTALMLAAGRGRLEIVKALLAAGADPNAVAFGHGGVPGWAWMFGMNRCNRHWLEITDAMLAAGVEVNPKAIYPSPLVYAIEKDDPVMIEALLKRGADVNLRDREGGETPLMFAARYSTPRVVTALIGAGADVNARTRAGKTALALTEGDEDNLWRDEIVALLRRSGASR